MVADNHLRLVLHAPPEPGQHLQQARSGHQMAVSAHRLNLLAEFFLPLATLSAIFGMEIPTGIERWPGHLVLATIIGSGLLLDLILMAFIARRWKPQ